MDSTIANRRFDKVEDDMTYAAEIVGQDLAKAFRTRVPLRLSGSVEMPGSIEDAYRVQRIFLSEIRASLVGWKIGATHERAQERFGYSEPIFGRVFRDRLYDSPVQLNRAEYVRPGLAVEFGFRLGRTIEARRTPHDRASVARAISAVVPFIEVGDSRIVGWPNIDGLALVADNGAHGALVIGREKEDL